MNQWIEFKTLILTHIPMSNCFFDKEAKAIQWEKKKTSSTNGAGITGCQHVGDLKQIHIYRHDQNSSPTGSKTNIKPVTLNLIEEKVEIN